MSELLKTKVTVYKGFLIIDTPDPQKSEGWVPNGPGKLGCVLMGTKERLAVSEEAIEALRKVKKGRDAIGDLMWFKANEKGHCFGWMGGPRRAVFLEHAQGDREFAVRDGEYVTVANDTPEVVRQAIDLLDQDDGSKANELFGKWVDAAGG